MEAPCVSCGEGALPGRSQTKVWDMRPGQSEW